MATNVAVRIRSSESGPAVNAFAIGPSDTQDLDYVIKSLWVGETGHVNCICVGASSNANTNAVNIGNIQTGTNLPVRMTRIFATGTTASGLVGFY